MGLPVVVIDDALCLNLGPMREFCSYKKAATSLELAQNVKEIIGTPSTDTSGIQGEPYIPGSDLARWRMLFDWQI